MNTTPNLPTSGQNGTSKNGSFGITPGEVVNLSDVIKNVKTDQPTGEVKQPTTYPTPKPVPAGKTPEAPKPPKVTAPAPEPVAPAPAPQAQQEEAPAPAQPEAPKRSRSEEIAFQVEKSRQMQLLNAQLLSLTTKLDELKKFSYTVDQEDDHRYAKFSIFDDGNREFNCKHHGLTAIVVEFLKQEFTAKIEAKENELLLVSQS